MTKTTTQILFALLLLLSQTAAVSHDVEHLGNAHDELCAVYVYQDHSADNNTACAESISYTSTQNVQLDIADIFEPAPASAYASRAPPKTIFNS